MVKAGILLMLFSCDFVRVGADILVKPMSGAICAALPKMFCGNISGQKGDIFSLFRRSNLQSQVI